MGEPHNYILDSTVMHTVRIYQNTRAMIPIYVPAPRGVADEEMT